MKLARSCSLVVPLLVLTFCIVWQARTIVLSIDLVEGEDVEDHILAHVSTFNLPQYAKNNPKIHPINNNKHRRLLILASAPKDERHVWTLWTELECFTSTVDHVIISAPTWSRDIINHIVQEAIHSIPQFVNRTTTVEAQFHVNDRYDVGLWCDPLKQLSSENDAFDEIGLLNDSVFALREYTAVFDALRERNVSLSSLSYSYSPKNFRGKPGKEHFWVESVFRALTPAGVKVFQNHSCLHPNHRKFCRGWPAKEQKGCIINNFEHDLASHFPEGDAFGFFETDAPPETKVPPYKAKQSWASNFLYWQKLVNESGFPVAKENIKESIPDIDSPLLKNCTRYLTQDRVRSWQLDFTAAESPFIEVM